MSDVEDTDANVILTCVTEYPGIKPVCLQKWGLRLAEGKYCQLC